MTLEGTKLLVLHSFASVADKVKADTLNEQFNSVFAIEPNMKIIHTIFRYT